MNTAFERTALPAMIAAIGLAGALPVPGHAQLADLADVPLANSPSDAVLPNLMYILDDSGSMSWDFMPDNVFDGPGADGAKQNCKRCTSSNAASCQTASMMCSDSPATGNGVSTWGEPPYYSAQFNQVYYNPDVSYTPGVAASGLSLGNVSPTAAPVDAYLNPGTTKNLVTTYPEIYYCNISSPTTAQLSDTTICRRNGINNIQAAPNNYFRFWSNNVTPGTPLGAYPVADGTVANSFRFQVVRQSGSPYYYRITPNEYCSDINLINCALANPDGSPPAGFTIPAPLRYCQTTTNAATTAVMSDPANSTNPKCRQQFVAGTYVFPRYGRFVRVDIVPAVTTYPKSPAAIRPDCAAAGFCTYAEELQNFANWYSYYRTRMMTMKTATGRAFLPIDDRYRVGFITINPGNPVLASRYVPLNTFSAGQKSAFYTRLYGTGFNGSTPLRQALSRIGRHYAGVTSGINSGMPTDPIQYSCQQNFALLTTDGYYNDSNSDAINITGGQVGHQDRVPTVGTPVYVSRSTGTLDGQGTAVTVVTTNTEVEQVICTVNNNAPFASGSTQSCGCGANQKRIKQRTRTVATTVVTTDGISGTPSVSTSGNSFSNISACVATATPLTIALTPNPTVTPAAGSPSTSTALGGAPDTLSDVAMYYYRTDLRTSGPVSANNVPTTDKDVAPHQHMVTFTLGLGLQGLMRYTPDYESNPASDFGKIRSGAIGTCSWTSGTCNWPIPTSGTATTLDDLWHAAVNGRGVFYSASDPNSLSDGLAGALSALKVQTAAASASATSSPNVTETDNFIYSSTFRTVKWDGEITAQRIDTATGNILPAIVWSAQSLLDARVAANSDTRAIWRFDNVAATKLKPFDWANLSAAAVGGIAAERPYFTNKCTALSQCVLLTVPNQLIANNGQKMVEYLRGWTENEGAAFRDREHVLGDTVNATPAYVRNPRFDFADAVTPTYGAFKSANANRLGVLFIAANDGMLHAFNGETGQEIWAYVPRMVFPKLHKLATDNWDVKHEYTVDGSPQTMDVFDTVAGAWKTILIGGLNKGGRGFYALDVTDPNNPKGLWEICSDSTLCLINDPDIGFSYGNAVITKRKTDGKWVALITSGINNVSPGTGRGYLYVLDAITGAILQKVDTGAGNTTTPSGLSKISAFANNFNVDNTAEYVYGGDLLGNVWRFDMGTSPPTVLKVAELRDSGGKPQSITSRPDLGVIDGNRVVYIGTGRYLGEDDLPDPATLSLPWAYQQSFYAIKDKNVAHGNIRSATPGLVQQTIIDSAGIRTTSNTAVDWTNKDGWFVDLNPGNTSPGERVNLDPQLILGTVVFVTNVPNNNACTVGGDSFIYQLDYRAGTYVASAPGQQAAQKFTGQITVGLVIVRLPSGVFKGIATGASGTKTPVGINVGGTGGAGRRISWRELFQ